MAKQSKQPVVYVARELRVYDNVGTNYVFGWFVSKAYLKRKTIDYTTSGDEYVNHIVDFNICPAIFAMDNNVNIHAENGDSEPKSEIFKNYISCKRYVKELNKGRLGRLTRNESEYMCEKITDKFEQVMKYAKYLEEKYIPLEERQQVSENINNY